MRPVYIRGVERDVELISEDDNKMPNEAITLKDSDAVFALRTLTMRSAIIPGPSNSLRECSLGIVYGNSARLLKENEQIVKNGSKYTHEWTFYVKPYNDSWDMSALLRECS